MSRLFRVTAVLLLAASIVAPISIVSGAPAPQDDPIVTLSPELNVNGTTVPQDGFNGTTVPQDGFNGTIVPQDGFNGTNAKTANFCNFIGNLPESSIKPPNVVVPTDIRVPPTEGIFYLRLFARGTQNYRCDAGVGWTFVEPKALLFNSQQQNNPIGTHFFLGQPDARGGQAVWAGASVQTCGAVVTKKIAQADSPNPAGNIPWLKTATTSSAGPGNGIISRANRVLRVLTRGGQPPASEKCGTTFANGQIFRSPYTAEYWFYRQP